MLLTVFAFPSAGQLQSQREVSAYLIFVFFPKRHHSEKRHVPFQASKAISGLKAQCVTFNDLKMEKEEINMDHVSLEKITVICY